MAARLADEKLLCCDCVTKVPVDKSKIVFEYQVVFEHQKRPQKTSIYNKKVLVFQRSMFLGLRSGCLEGYVQQRSSENGH